ncbi:MAG TPA: sensor domain-containing diguanylate cyclase [Gammaproteobacteria bacterium]
MEQQQEEVGQLREQLEELLVEAHRNQQKMRLFSEQELQLIGITALPELLTHLLYRLPAAFALDAISLLLIDSDYEVSRLLAHEPLPSLQVPELMIAPDETMVCGVYHNSTLPHLSTYRAEYHPLFHNAVPPQSVALLPLVRGGRMVGSLHFGSRDPQRFNTGSATDFLQHLAVIVAVCLENCINHARLKQIGLTDPLTGVSNRRYFEQRLIEACATAQRHHRPLAALFVDVDHFKRINDTWGHPVGDSVLRDIAHLIAAQLRHSDVLCRYGGEEFVILLPDTTREAARDIAERIRLAVADHPFEIPTRVTISAGVSALEQFAETDFPAMSQQLVATADAALYRAKQQGRDRVVVSEGDGL